MDFQPAPALSKVLIVEDEILVADDLRSTLEELGYHPIGIAPDKVTALALAQAGADIALVDLNLRDGATGAAIGEKLAADGVAVLFVTANPRSLGQGVPGAVGVVSKPLDSATVAHALAWVRARVRGVAMPPPRAVTAFA